MCYTDGGEGEGDSGQIRPSDLKVKGSIQKLASIPTSSETASAVASIGGGANSASESQASQGPLRVILPHHFITEDIVQTACKCFVLQLQNATTGGTSSGSTVPSSSFRRFSVPNAGSAAFARSDSGASETAMHVNEAVAERRILEEFGRTITQVVRASAQVKKQLALSVAPGALVNSSQNDSSTATATAGDTTLVDTSAENAAPPASNGDSSLQPPRMKVEPIA